MKRLVILMVFCFLAGRCLSQEHIIHVIAQPAADSIVVRWAPSTARAWQLLNKYGYRVERYTIMRDSAILDTKPVLIIQPVPLKPMALNEWEGIIDTDDYAAIAAQAIYGETFQMDMKSNDIMQIVNKIKELDSRFSYTLFAADMSAKAASLAGLRYVDKNVKKNERYLYRVYSMVPSEILSIEMGFFYTSPMDARPLPAIQDISLESGDKSVLLSWDIREFSSIYSGYFIERSDDGNTFRRINNLPYVPVKASTDDQYFKATFLDSLRSNDITVYYRISGVTPFAETGPSSKPVSGKGMDKTDLSVKKVEGRIIDSSVYLEWTFSGENEALINGFEVERSRQAESGFKAISQLLNADVRSYEDKNSLSTNYYRIVSIDKRGKKKYSFPILIQQADSVPPASPEGIAVQIDSLGIVRLSWSANQEPDLLGYRVYRSNFRSSEFSQITVEPVTTTFLIDTVNIKTLTRQCYYKLTAVDSRFNTSTFSDVKEVILPDVISPVAVVITSARATDKGIELSWTKCSSEDAAHYQIYRKAVGSDDATLIATRVVDSTQLVDMPPEERVYAYWIEVVDKSGLVSSPSRQLLISPLKMPVKTVFANVKVVADREKKQINLSWRQKEDDQLKSIQVYRYKEGRDQLTLYKTLPGKNRSFSDDNVSLNTRYGYRLKAVYRNGKESEFSNEVNISF